jgi:DNA-binding protein HU-beta
MRKSEWIAQVAKQANVSQVEAGKVLNTALDVVAKTLAGGDKLTLTGFGTFEVRKSAARTGTHPRTGEKIRIAARQRPAFTAGTALRDAVAHKAKPKPKAKAAPKPAANKPGRK